MKVKTALALISSATRSADWRLSFVPFIMACVYLWSSLFHISFSLVNLGVFILSVSTTFGFAALGYFINEFFDKADDLKAGKLNKLSLVAGKFQVALFLVILAVCFLPWLYLPKDEVSLYLILAEIGCFLVYSSPCLRLKKSTYFAGILDALYAYLIPGLLSFQTYALLSGVTLKVYPILFFVAIFFIGYRNIFLHQIKDVLGDQKSGMTSLPHRLGVERSYTLLKAIYFLEIALLLAFSAELIYIHKIYAPWLAIALGYLIYVREDLRKLFVSEPYFALLPVRHVLDLLYQLFFPLLQLLILVWIDWRWLLIVPFHLLLFVNRDFIVDFYGRITDYLWHRSLRPSLSAVLNYPIFLLFKLFGIDLVKEQQSAFSYLKNKFR
jgi:4-hydroxybenzoate polyprenyltransferase